MLASMGCEYVIVGHSERRMYFKESNAVLREKIQRCLESDLSPIYCIGETLEERKAGKYKDVITEQMHHLWSLDPEDFRNVIIAYEPVWAIGTGETASPEQAQEVHAYIRIEISKKMSAEVAKDTVILYGGSVKPNNAKELFSQADIDGGLIGGASLTASDFVAIIKAL
jgi:triosephosphate isomerase